MLRVITPERMQALERQYMAESGTPGLLLMERAAEAIAKALEEMTDGGILFFCGPGNNGGDGYAAARLLSIRGRSVWIWTIADPQTLAGDARVNMERCAALGIPIRHLSSIPGEMPEGWGALADALFGTGLARPLDGLYADAVRFMNGSGLPVLAVDMPSGTPELMVWANRTVTFHQIKPMHLLFPGRTHTGALTVADIGIPHAALPDDYEVLEPADTARLLPPRPLDAHKGVCGHALLLAGSMGMAGAAGLCANATLRGGAGLVTVACPAPVIPVLQVLSPCATCVSADKLEAAIAGKTAIAAGPGLGMPESVGPLLETLLLMPQPQVWDADALNWLALNPRRLGSRFVITPHPGEAARLLGSETYEVTADPLRAAERLFERFGAVVLLKGATTVIVGENRHALNITGTPGMATGGSGDVLTGLIAALLAQGLAPFDAAQLSAALHGLAGEEAARRRGVRSMTAQDLLDALRID